MAFDIKFNTKILDGLSNWDEEVRSRIGVDRFPRRQGAIIAPVPLLAERIVRARGQGVFADEAAVRTYLRELGGKLHGGAGQLQLRDDNSYLNAVKENYGYSFVATEAPSRMFRYFVDFVCGDPYWYSTTESSSAQAAIGSSPHTFSVTNNGGEVTPVRIEIDANASDRTGTFRLDNTTHGLAISWTGTLPANQILTMDCANQKVVASGADGLNNFSGSFWSLVTGLNNLVYSGPVGVDVTVYWRERWS